MRSASTFSDRRGLWACIVGVIGVTTGVVMQFFAMLALVPALAIISVIVPTILAWGFVGRFGKETSGRDLHDLDPAAHAFAATGM